MRSQTHLFQYQSPLGPIGLLLRGDVCQRIILEPVDAPLCSPDHPVAAWLRGYFAGQSVKRPVMAPPVTPFQGRLRKALVRIPRGKVKTYGELAAELDTSPRAVGQALGANPCPILVPCHRVVGASGLGGFSGGINWKRKLLRAEGYL